MTLQTRTVPARYLDNPRQNARPGANLRTLRGHQVAARQITVEYQLLTIAQHQILNQKAPYHCCQIPLQLPPLKPLHYQFCRVLLVVQLHRSAT